MSNCIWPSLSHLWIWYTLNWLKLIQRLGNKYFKQKWYKMDAHIWYTAKLHKYSTICVLNCHKQIYNTLKKERENNHSLTHCSGTNTNTKTTYLTQSKKLKGLKTEMRNKRTLSLKLLISISRDWQWQMPCSFSITWTFYVSQSVSVSLWASASDRHNVFI